MTHRKRIHHHPSRRYITEYRGTSAYDALYAYIFGAIYDVDTGGQDRAVSIGGYPIGLLLSQFVGKEVWARYGISDRPITPNQMLEAMAASVDGAPSYTENARWTETTGHLYTVTTGMIGGHDLLGPFVTHMPSGPVPRYGFIAISTVPFDEIEYQLEDAGDGDRGESDPST